MTAHHHPRTARIDRHRVGVAGILPIAALLLIAGCASSDSAPVADTEAPATDTATDAGTTTDGDTSTDEEEPAEDANSDDDEVVVVGGELVDDSFVLIGAEQYAKGREPIPTVTFTGPLSVTFTFATTLDEAVEIGNCQIAYGVLSGSGVDITIVDDDSTVDCTALVDG